MIPYGCLIKVIQKFNQDCVSTMYLALFYEQNVTVFTENIDTKKRFLIICQYFSIFILSLLALCKKLPALLNSLNAKVAIMQKPVNCRANQLTRVYMMGTLGFNDLITIDLQKCERTVLLNIRLYPANICLFKVNNRNTKKQCEICSKLTKIR